MSLGKCTATVLSAIFLLLPPLTRAESEPGLVWALTGKSNTVYLAGSIHLLREADHPLPETYEHAFEDSRVMVVEVDEKQMSHPSAMAGMLKKALYPQGESLQKKLSRETLDVITAADGHVTAALQAMSAYRPWFAAMTLTLTELTKIGVRPEHGAEAYFTRKAVKVEKGGMPIESLETIEEQIALLADLTPEQQDVFLRMTIQDLDTVEKMYLDLIRLWRQGRATELDEKLNRQLNEYPEIKNRLLLERNRNWLKKIRDDYAKRDKNIFILVGAAHLVGEGGLVGLLEEEGWTVGRLGSVSPAAAARK